MLSVKGSWHWPLESLQRVHLLRRELHHLSCEIKPNLLFKPGWNPMGITIPLRSFNVQLNKLWNIQCSLYVSVHWKELWSGYFKPWSREDSDQWSGQAVVFILFVLFSSGESRWPARVSVLQSHGQHHHCDHHQGTQSQSHGHRGNIRYQTLISSLTKISAGLLKLLWVVWVEKKCREVCHLVTQCPTPTRAAVYINTIRPKIDPE